MDLRINGRRYPIIGDTEGWAQAFQDLASDTARMAYLDEIEDALRNLRREVTKQEAIVTAVTRSTRTWTTPTKADFTDDVKGINDPTTYGQTTHVYGSAKSFYEKVAEIDA